MQQDLPNMNTSTYTSNSYTGAISQLTTTAHPHEPVTFADMPHPVAKAMGTVQEKEMAKPSRRYVQIFIVDPDERVPLEKSVIHEGEPFLTDSTDQELFYGLEIKSMLDDYNAFRQTVLDKNAAQKFGRDVFLDPVKIRDLTMTVVEIATF